jgi:transposase
MMAFSVPPSYRRSAPVKRPKLVGFTWIIDGWLEVHRKQWHTANRVFERLRDEHGFTGGYTIVNNYMRQRDRRGREIFVSLAHPPGWHLGGFCEDAEARLRPGDAVT